MKLSQRLAAVGLSAMMVLSFGACSTADTTWIAEYNGEKIPAGAYLLAQLSAFTEAQGKVEDTSKDLFDNEIDGKNAKDWINEEAKKTILQDIAINELFKEKNLSLTDKDKDTLETYISQVWKVYGETYTKNGIAEESVRYLNETTVKSNKIFESIYGEGGEKAVNPEEIKAQFQKQFIKVTYFVMNTQSSTNESSSSGASSDSSTETANSAEAVKAKAQEYVERINGGEDIYKVIREYETATTASGEKIHCDASGQETHDTLDDANSTIFPTGFHDEAAKLETGKAMMFETTGYIVVAQKRDVMADPEDYENNKLSVLYDMKSDEYGEYLDTLQPKGEVTFNEDSLKRYTPDKLKKQADKAASKAS